MEQKGRCLELGKKVSAAGPLRPEKMGRLRRWSEGEEMCTGSGPPHCQEGKEGSAPEGTASIGIIPDLVAVSRAGENQLAVASEEGKERRQREKVKEGGDHTYAAMVDLPGRRRRSTRCR